MMRLLLTSAGISNTSIHDSLVDLLGKPIAESRALFIPTALHALPGGADIAYRVIRGSLGGPFCELGWKSLGVLELTALPSIKEEHWVPLVQEMDALLVGGGDCQYLCYWMQKSGLADLLPSLRHEMVYVGLSAGSMVVTSFGTTFGGHTLPTDSDKALGLVNFALLPHLDHERFPENSLANLEKEAAAIPVPTYAIDDQTAIKVIDGAVDVVSEGHWKLFTP
jgi:dipeptidase E